MKFSGSRNAFTQHIGMKGEAKLELSPSDTRDNAVHPTAGLNGIDWLTGSMEEKKHTTCKPKLRALGKKKKKKNICFFYFFSDLLKLHVIVMTRPGVNKILEQMAL